VSARSSRTGASISRRLRLPLGRCKQTNVRRMAKQSGRPAHSAGQTARRRRTGGQAPLWAKVAPQRVRRCAHHFRDLLPPTKPTMRHVELNGSSLRRASRTAPSLLVFAQLPQPMPLQHLLASRGGRGGGAPMIAPGRRLARVSGHSSGSWVVKISSLPFGPPICSLVSLAEPKLGAGAIFTSAPIARFVSMARRYLARPPARCRGRDQV